MRKTDTICDACGKVLSNEPKYYLHDLDLCSACTDLAVTKYLQNRGRPLRTRCVKCRGKGVCRVKDKEATSAQATCGENRIQYKAEVCTECVF